MIKIFYDLETTGLKPDRHCIHQMSGLIEIDDEVVDSFDFKLSPHPKAAIDKIALHTSKVSLEDIQNYPDWELAYHGFISILHRYIDKYDTKDKAFLVGFNNRSFDDDFLRKFFELNNDKYYGSWFWSNTIDSMNTATEYLLLRRPRMINFKLMTVAKELGIEVDESLLHEAGYDVFITRQVYRITSDLELEL